MIQYAYSLQPAQLAGGPDWTRDGRYDITAKDEEFQADEARQSDANVVTRDGRARLRLRDLLEERCRLKLRQEIRDLPVYGMTVDKGGLKLKATAKGRGTVTTNRSHGNRSMRGDGVLMKRLAENLGAFVGRPVVDETGLDGLFDFDLAWSDTEPDAAAPSIFTALREQLGLRLDARRRAVSVSVVETIEKPSENQPSAALGFGAFRERRTSEPSPRCRRTPAARRIPVRLRDGNPTAEHHVHKGCN